VPGRRSISEIVAHLADTELVLAFRMRFILGAPGSPIAAFYQDRFDPHIPNDTNSPTRGCARAIGIPTASEDRIPTGSHAHSVLFAAALAIVGIWQTRGDCRALAARRYAAGGFPMVCRNARLNDASD
jgi:hypothetical protein